MMIPSKRHIELFCVALAAAGAAFSFSLQLNAEQVSSSTQTDAFPHTLQGRVITVLDGDSVIVLTVDRQQQKIRLQGIDSPEQGQDFGKRARQMLARKLKGKTVTVRWSKLDDHGRVLGHIYRGKRWINHEMIRDGWAWHFKHFSRDADLASAELAAREAKRGLWSAPNRPIPPWDYRQPVLVVDQTPGATSSSYWLNTSTNARHNERCKYYHNTQEGRPCSSSEGQACGICGG